MPLTCDCYAGCWGDHVVERHWPFIDAVAVNGNIALLRHTAQGLNFPRGSYVSIGQRLYLENNILHNQMTERLFPKSNDTEGTVVMKEVTLAGTLDFQVRKLGVSVASIQEGNLLEKMCEVKGWALVPGSANKKGVTVLVPQADGPAKESVLEWDDSVLLTLRDLRVLGIAEV